ncbi:hypothetical protein J7E50_17965 [Pedobacter sp. ISL-68]|uniref:hypothetical protein n=1 Tax=unclassified Pedobacter TaxID=2628915 RepID=UPI001BE72FC3|nr:MULTISPECIES: hypothetical protein [unclassified Pedobacter]MBT2559810.1 hypothetical protein [Pedobacter sp. ISL-64]MBT2592115.1 hypothetical protein [Pedobacter sp. ISL-68]
MAKKRKKKGNKEAKRTMPRARRLQSAKQWLPTYTGKHLVRAYARHYHTDLLCSITELRILGITVTEEYETAVKRSVELVTAQKKQMKEAALAKSRGLVWGINQDENFAFIVGHTSGGAP